MRLLKPEGEFAKRQMTSFSAALWRTRVERVKVHGGDNVKNSPIDMNGRRLLIMSLAIVLVVTALLGLFLPRYNHATAVHGNRSSPPPRDMPAIYGIITDANTGAPLSGIELWAETFGSDAGGLAYTNANGW